MVRSVQNSSTVAIWWLDMIRYFPAAISSRMIPLNRSVLMGSRPDRGSSRISSSGSDSRAAISWIFC